MNIRTFWKGALASGGNPVLPRVAPDATPVAHTASVVLVVGDLNSIHTNTSASATLTFTLPAASVSDTKALKVQLTAAQIIQIIPASGDKIYLGGSGVADKYLQIAGVIGNCVDLYCDGSNWLTVGYSGVATKQP